MKSQWKANQTPLFPKICFFLASKDRKPLLYLLFRKINKLGIIFLVYQVTLTIGLFILNPAKMDSIKAKSHYMFKR